MALNIKTDHVCELARRAAERTGLTQVSVLERALEQYLEVLDSAAAAPDEDEAERRRRGEARVLLGELRTRLTDEDRAAIRQGAEGLYDEAGLSR